MRAGQFASVGVRGHLLRRPFAICKAEGERISLCFQVRGEGTRNLASMGAGESLQVLMPLGNGFFVERDEKRVALVGGGVGIFPMIAALREYAPTKEVFAYIGFRNKEAVCGLEEFERAARLKAVTDDGSYGEKKNAVQAAGSAPVSCACATSRTGSTRGCARMGRCSRSGTSFSDGRKRRALWRIYRSISAA